jgi:translation elongation factor EF-Tu-like GTPase
MPAQRTPFIVMAFAALLAFAALAPPSAQQALADEPAARVMSIEDVFTLSGGRLVVTGMVEAEVWDGDELILESAGGQRRVTVEMVEIFGMPAGRAVRGDPAGLFLSGISVEDVRPGDVLTGTGAE